MDFIHDISSNRGGVLSRFAVEEEE